jgi:hypothetical protein
MESKAAHFCSPHGRVSCILSIVLSSECTVCWSRSYDTPNHFLTFLYCIREFLDLNLSPEGLSDTRKVGGY